MTSEVRAPRSHTVSAAAEHDDWQPLVASRGHAEEGAERTVAGRLDAILASFDGSDHVLTLSEISHRVGLPKSSVHRLADQLCSVGWLERNSGGYRIGLKLLEFGGIALQRNSLRDLAFGHLYRLAERTGLAVQLAILDQDAVVYLERISLTSFGPPTRLGSREPAYCTGLGKAILAFEDERGQASALEIMPRRTEFTITDPRTMRAEFETISRSGVAYDRGEAYPGLACVASPIRSTGRAVGALSVTGPIGRIRSRSLVEDVRSTAVAVWRGHTGMSVAPLLSASHAGRSPRSA